MFLTFVMGEKVFFRLPDALGLLFLEDKLGHINQETYIYFLCFAPL